MTATMIGPKTDRWCPTSETPARRNPVSAKRPQLRPCRDGTGGAAPAPRILAWPPRAKASHRLDLEDPPLPCEVLRGRHGTDGCSDSFSGGQISLHVPSKHIPVGISRRTCARDFLG